MSDNTENDPVPRSAAEVSEAAEIPLRELGSPTLDRLIEEVRNGDTDAPNAYNRVHHRHNR